MSAGGGDEDQQQTEQHGPHRRPVGLEALAFVAAQRRAGLSSWVSSRCVALPLEYLREVGVAPPPVPVVADGPVEVLLEGYASICWSSVAWCARRSFVTSASRGCFSSSGRSGLSLTG